MALARNSAVEPDTASKLLVTELMLNDIAAVQATRKGKADKNIRPSDEEIAFNLQTALLNAHICTLHDRRFASSIDRAIESDASQLRRHVRQERAEHDDHLVAVALQHGHDLPQQTGAQRMLEKNLGRGTRLVIQDDIAAIIDL